jgi:hypothetical protein
VQISQAYDVGILELQVARIRLVELEEIKRMMDLVGKYLQMW